MGELSEAVICINLLVSVGLWWPASSPWPHLWCVRLLLVWWSMGREYNSHTGSFPCMFVPGNPQRSRNAHHRMGSEIYLPLIFITHPLTGKPQWPSSSTGIDVHLELISNNLWKVGYFPVFIAQICVSTALGSMRQCKESMYNIRCTFSREPSSTVLRFPSFLHFIPIILLF